MKIELKHENPFTYYFDDLDFGDVFTFVELKTLYGEKPDNRFFMKVKQSNPSNTVVGFVSLKDGYFTPKSEFENGILMHSRVIKYDAVLELSKYCESEMY